MKASSKKQRFQLLLLLALGSFGTLTGQSVDQSCDPETEPNCYLRLQLAAHPLELPAGGTIVSLERLSNWGVLDHGCINDAGTVVPSIVNRGGPSRIIAILVGLFAPGVLDVISSEGPCGFGNPILIPAEFPIASILAADAPRHVIFAGSEPNNIQTDVGHDVILAGGAADMILGGRGNDFIFGDAGDDVLGGGAGDDSVLGGDGDDVIRGDSGNDQLRGGAGNDTILGGAGDDQLFGGVEAILSTDGGGDQISGGDGNDLIVGGGGQDLLRGGEGNDTIFAGLEEEAGSALAGPELFLFPTGFKVTFDARIDGGAGNDILIGSDGRDAIRGGPGNDLIVGNSGADRLLGGRGNDQIFAGGFESGDVSANVVAPGPIDSKPGTYKLVRNREVDLIVPGRGVDQFRPGTSNSIAGTESGQPRSFIVLSPGDVGLNQRERIRVGSNDRVWINGFGISVWPADSQLSDPSQGGTEPSGPQVAEIIDPFTGGVFSIEGEPVIESVTVLAQIGNGGGLTSDLVLTNPSRFQTATVNVSFSGPTGDDLNLPIEGQQPAVSELELEIPPLGARTLRTTGEGDTQAAAAQIVSNVPIGAVVRFAVEDQGIAGVPEGDLSESILIPVTQESAAGLATGFALFNLGGDEEFTLTLSHLDGTPLISRQRQISGDGHVSIFVDELFRGLSDFRGVLRIDGSFLSGAAIQMGSQPGQFTTLPVIPGDLTASEDPLVFAQFGNGAGFSSSIFLINSSNSTATGRLEFFNDNGNSLDVGLSAGVPAGDPQFSIPPGGGAVFETDGSGDVVVGSARVILDTGIVGGVLRFALPGIGLAGVGISPSLEGVIIPVRRSASAGLSTGVAIAAMQDAAAANCTLRTVDGEEVVGGIAEISLPANGHTARFLEELFPEVDTLEFEGVLTVESSNGARFASTAIELGRSAGEFTTLVTEEIRLRQP